MKKASIPLVPMKLVRIDARTQVEVLSTVSDKDAIRRFNECHESYRNYAGQGTPNIPNAPNMPVKEEFTEYNELPVGDIADLAAVVEELTLPETE
jgi:hypothetical protein